MSRRRKIGKREISTDTKYEDLMVAKFINVLMLSGKKSLSEKIVYSALEELGKKVGDDDIVIFKEAVSNASPNLEVRSRRVGGATYQVPLEVNEERSRTLAYRWLINAARKRGEKTMSSRLYGELLDAYNKRGTAYKKKEEIHKIAEANRAFSHYRW